MKLFIYCRGNETEIDRQEKATTEFAKFNALVVPRIFRESAIASGTYHWKCPKLNAAYSFAAAGLPNRAAEGVLVETINALGSDKLTIALALYAAEWAGVGIYSLANGVDKPIKAEDDELRKLIVGAIEAGIAWDRHLKSQHLAEARKCARRKVDFNADDLSEDLGYARRGDLEQRKFERAIVGWVFFQRFEKKMPFPAIAKLLAKNRIPIPNPNFSASRPWQGYRGPFHWTVDTIRNTLSHWKARTDLIREFYKDELPTKVPNKIVI